MASYGTIQRPSTSSTSASIRHSQASPSSTHIHRKTIHFTLLNYFSIPTSPEAAAVRVIRNLGYFRVYYTLVVWLILFVSLIPRRRISLIFLLVTTAVGCFYLMLLRVIPDSVVLHKVIDPRLVLALLGIVTIVELVLTRAVIHLLVSLAIGVVIIFVHAILRMGDDLYVNEEASAAGELVPLVDRTETAHEHKLTV